MDFLAKHAVCTVGVLKESFAGQSLKLRILDTLSYLNQPLPSYYDPESLKLALDRT